MTTPICSKSMGEYSSTEVEVMYKVLRLQGEAVSGDGVNFLPSPPLSSASVGNGHGGCVQPRLSISGGTAGEGPTGLAYSGAR